MRGKQVMRFVWTPIILAGCTFSGDGTPQVLGPQAFYDVQPAPGEQDRRQGVAVDRAGAIVHNPAMLDTPAPPEPAPIGPLPTELPPVTRPSEIAITPAEALPPATLPAGVGGQFVTAGAVVVNVGDKPIYADQVLRKLSPALSARAKEETFQTFRATTQKEVRDQISNLVWDEVRYKTAQQNLSSADKQQADMMTAGYRQRLITEAGGSEEQARAKSRSEGLELEEKVNDYNRFTLYQIYLRRKILPLVMVSAQDIRDYYTTHQNEFTETDRVQFRVIKVNVDPAKGRGEALDRVRAVHEKLASASPAEFAAGAVEANDDRALKSSGGRIGSGDGWLQKGSFAVKEVEDAVWKLQPGQTTEVIPAGNSFYIARLEDRKLGTVRAFEEEAVQTEIKDKLQTPQIRKLTNELEQRLIREAVIYPETPNYQAVIDMALQKYSQWRTAK